MRYQKTQEKELVTTGGERSALRPAVERQRAPRAALVAVTSAASGSAGSGCYHFPDTKVMTYG